MVSSQSFPVSDSGPCNLFTILIHTLLVWQFNHHRDIELHFAGKNDESLNVKKHNSFLRNNNAENFKSLPDSITKTGSAALPKFECGPLGVTCGEVSRGETGRFGAEKDQRCVIFCVEETDRTKQYELLENKKVRRFEKSTLGRDADVRAQAGAVDGVDFKADVTVRSQTEELPELREGNEQSLLEVSDFSNESILSARTMSFSSTNSSSEDTNKFPELNSADFGEVFFMFTNARSLPPKIKSLVEYFDLFKLSFAIITESWLASGTNLEEELRELEYGTSLKLIYKN